MVIKIQVSQSRLGESFGWSKRVNAQWYLLELALRSRFVGPCDLVGEAAGVSRTTWRVVLSELGALRLLPRLGVVEAAFSMCYKPIDQQGR